MLYLNLTLMLCILKPKLNAMLYLKSKLNAMLYLKSKLNAIELERNLKMNNGLKEQ